MNIHQKEHKFSLECIMIGIPIDRNRSSLFNIYCVLVTVPSALPMRSHNSHNDVMK